MATLAKIQSENESYFIPNEVKQILKTAQAKQDFTHFATSIENACLKAFN